MAVPRTGQKKNRLPGPTERQLTLRAEAIARQEKWDALTLSQKIEKIQKREALGLNCSRERAKFNKLMMENQKKKAPILQQVSDENAVAVKEAKREKQQKKVQHDQERKKEIGN